MGSLPKLAILLLSVAAMALAGCAGASNSQTESDDVADDEDFQDLGLQADETTGILRGVVVDEAIRPLANVSVVLLIPNAANRTQTTQDDGIFGFDKLLPGTYFLQVSAPGYISVQTSGNVEAGVENPDILKIQLPADPLSRPYVATFLMDGFMECSARPMFIGAQCNLPGGEDSRVNAEYPLDGVQPQWIQSEMIWDSTQAIGDELSLAIRCNPNADPAGKCQDGVAGIVRAEGKSPQVARVNRTLIEQWALGGVGGDPLTINLFAYGRSDLDVWDEAVVDNAQKPVTGNDCMQWGAPGQIVFGFAPASCMRLTGPGVVYNQKIEVYTHAFYGFTPRENWVFSLDGPHPVPA